MPDLIKIKIDVTKIDKARLFAGKTGAKYLDATLVPSQNDKYGNDYFIAQDVKKEEREAGVKGAIIGNAKIFPRNGGYAQPTKPNSPLPQQRAETVTQKNDDVPF